MEQSQEISHEALEGVLGVFVVNPDLPNPRIQSPMHVIDKTLSDAQLNKVAYQGLHKF